MGDTDGGGWREAERGAFFIAYHTMAGAAPMPPMPMGGGAGGPPAGPAPATFFPGAPGEDVVRSVQRDGFAMHDLRESVRAAAAVVLGPRRATQFEQWIGTLSDVLYFCVTSLAGTQTVGEEYGELIQYSAQTGRYPNFVRRLLSIVMHIGGPAVLTMFFRRATKGSSPTSIAGLVMPHERVAGRISRWQQLHLGWFYINGKFHDLSKRILGISYFSTTQPSDATPFLGFLGALIVFQCAVRVILAVRAWIKRRSELRAKAAALGDFSADAAENSDDEQSGEGGGSMCSLCLNECKSPTSTPCGHLFCWNCICDWCNKKPQCPVCRTPAAHNQLWACRKI